MSKNEIYILLGLYFVINILLLFAFNYMVFNDSFYFNALGSQFEYEDIQKFLNVNRKVAFLSYLFIPLIFLIRILCVSVGFKIYTDLIDENLNFRSIFSVVLVCESVFVFQIIFKLLYILFYGATVENAQTMGVLFSLNQIFKNKPEYLNYLFSCISIFDFVYCLFLAFIYSYKFKSGIKKGLVITVNSYLPLLIIWITIVTFIIL